MIEIERRCMLACQQVVTPGDLRHLLRKHGPLQGTYKIDGIRCRIHSELDEETSAVMRMGMTRKWLLVPNNMIQDWIQESRHLRDGMDGELVVKGKGFNDSQKFIMAGVTAPFDWTYYIFDYCVPKRPHLGYLQRLQKLKAIYKWNRNTQVLWPEELSKVQQIKDMEKKAIDEGFEGIILRRRDGRYKHGRATWEEGLMFKMKRFVDGEAMVIGFEAKMQNNNEKIADEQGFAKRSKHKTNRVEQDTLGALKVRDLDSGVEFNVGSGWDQEQAEDIWRNRPDYLREIITYTKAQHGEKNKPRQPIFKGFRND